jgi:hypothetical protein
MEIKRKWKINTQVDAKKDGDELLDLMMTQG